MWPGCSVEVKTLEEIAGKLHEITRKISEQKDFKNLRAPLRELATKAREQNEPVEALRSNIIAMADNREKAHQWTGLKKIDKNLPPAREFLEDAMKTESIEIVRFALEALLIKVGKGDSDDE
jgi:hypothetical protein